MNLLQEIKSKVEELASETDNLRKSAVFQAYLDTMAKFWEYSYRNQLLIHFAMPSATKIAGFRTWQQLGRKVKKGSKSIKILAPSTKKEEDEEITYFFPVSVFDISQTEGAELPALSINIAGDDHQQLLDCLMQFCTAKQIVVEFKALGINGLHGYSKGGSVVVSSLDSVNMQVNTLIHEIAHELLHRNSSLSKSAKEIQAEGVAYVVCKHFGLETRSVNYLGLYNASFEKIMEHLSVISLTAKEVIEDVFLFF